MTVSFKRIEGRHWLGNGFGYEPARYGVYRDGKEVATITSIAEYWYIHTHHDDGWRPVGGAYKLAQAKQKAREIFEQPTGHAPGTGE